MLYIICYDIEQDILRNKISHILQGFGKRVQKSVFECELDEKTLQRLLRQLECVFKGQGQDSLRIYPLCQTCKRRAMGIGSTHPGSEERSYIYL